MPLTFDQRALTCDELSELSGSTKRIWLTSIPGVILRYVLVFLLLMGLVMSVVAVLDGMTRQSPAAFSLMQWKPPSWAVPLLIVSIWAPIVLVPVWFATRSLRRNLRRQRARTRDRDGGYACIARVVDARFIGLVSKVGGERLLFEVDAGRGLLIDAERPRFDRPLFGLPEPEYDEDEEDDAEHEDDDMTPEGATGQTPFPNSRFDLHWLPHSGRMLRIEAHGTTVTPLRVLLENELSLPEIASFTREPEREVMLIDRSLETVLAAARIAT